MIQNKIEEQIISINQLEIIEDFNPRDINDYNEDEILDTFSEHGILNKIKVVPSSKNTEDGKPIYFLFDGHRRFTALKKYLKQNNLSNLDIPVEIHEKQTEDKLLIKAYVLGSTGRQLKTTDKIKVIERLSKFLYTDEQIGNSLKINIQNVKLLKKFSKLTPDLQKFVNDEILSFHQAIKLFESVNDKKGLVKFIEETYQNKGKVTSKTIADFAKENDNEELNSVKSDILSGKTINQRLFDDAEVISLNNNENNELNIQNKEVDSEIDNNLNQEVYNENNNSEDNNNNSEDNNDNSEDNNDNNEDNNDNSESNINKPKNKIKNKKLNKLLDYINSQDVKLYFNFNNDKIELLKNIIKYENDEISMEEIIDNLC
jgi:ParB-like chromosome segregation protein Spo0J